MRPLPEKIPASSQLRQEALAVCYRYCTVTGTKTQLPNCLRMVRVFEDPRDRSWVDLFLLILYLNSHTSSIRFA